MCPRLFLLSLCLALGSCACPEGNLCASGASTCVGDAGACTACVENAEGGTAAHPNNCNCVDSFYQSSSTQCTRCDPSLFCDKCLNATHCAPYGCVPNAGGLPDDGASPGACQCDTGPNLYRYGYECILKEAPDFVEPANATCDTVILTWLPSPGAPDIDYELMRGTTSSNMQPIYNGTQRSFTATGLASGSTYLFRVASRDMYTRSMLGTFIYVQTDDACAMVIEEIVPAPMLSTSALIGIGVGTVLFAASAVVFVVLLRRYLRERREREVDLERRRKVFAGVELDSNESHEGLMPSDARMGDIVPTTAEADLIAEDEIAGPSTDAL